MLGLEGAGRAADEIELNSFSSARPIDLPFLGFFTFFFVLTNGVDRFMFLIVKLLF